MARRRPYNFCRSFSVSAVVMILSCPNCGTRYTVASSSLPPGGRKVRCAKCGEVWRQVPEDDESPVSFASELDSATRFDDSRLPDEPPAFDPAPPKPSRHKREKRKGKAWIAWAVSGVVLAGAVGGAVLARDAIVRAWPPSMLLFTAVGLPVEPPGEGLTLSPPKAEISVKNGDTVLTLEGRVTNGSDRKREVPSLRVIPSDAGGADLAEWSLVASPTTLKPGETATYRDERPVKPETANVTVSFF